MPVINSILPKPGHEIFNTFGVQHLTKVKPLSERTLAELRNDFGGVFVQPKLDGIRVLIMRGKKEIRALTRTGLQELGGPIVRQIPALLKLPPQTCLDCELTAGRHSIDVISFIKSNKHLRLHIFAIPVYAGRDLRSHTFDMASRCLRTDVPSLEDSIVRSHDLIDENLHGYQLSASHQKIEGWVIKVEHYDGWYKVKPAKTADLIVQSIQEGKGKYKGMIGALFVGLKRNGLPLCKVGTGMDDETRAMGKKLIGKVVEVQYDSRTSQGSLRFPRLLRIRWDKHEKDCNIT